MSNVSNIEKRAKLFNILENKSIYLSNFARTSFLVNLIMKEYMLNNTLYGPT